MERLADEKTTVRKVTQRIFYVLLLSIFGIVGAYIVICLCWCILGAVLNPEIFLPYAAAAATFLGFIAYKLSAASELVSTVS